MDNLSVGTSSTDREAPTIAGSRVLDHVVIRFAGDSGDGMQLTGDRFTNESAVLGNDLATLPEYPAEIRAPAGTLPGVSSFQVQISDHDILTPGDHANVLVAMNPAALRANLAGLPRGSVIILNRDTFDERSLAKAGYQADPRSDGSLGAYKVYEVPMTALTQEACKPTGAKPRDAERSKNFFALGLISWLYTRPIDETLAWIQKRFGGSPVVGEANRLAFMAGYHFGETAEVFESPFEVRPAKLAPGTYANITGNTALAWGLVAAAHRAKLPLFLGSYPITPASDLLHELSKLKRYGVYTFQAEDEIAGVGAALGASYGGAIGVTTTSGPGADLKAETIGLAVALELPLVVVDVQRAGPSTGMPTKPEQADLLLAMYGRHGEAPLPIVAARDPAHCFEAAFEAVRIALTYLTPVFLLSDAYLANGSEPWRIPDVDSLPVPEVHFATEPNHSEPDGTRAFYPYERDPESLVRPFALPGTPGLEHRVGGLEKADGSGNVSYDPDNHEHMVRVRAEKIARIARSIPPAAVEGDPEASLLVLGWGSTYGAIATAVANLRAHGHEVAHVHLTHLNPFPANLGEVLASFERIIVPEINLGQLTRLVRAEYLVDARPVTQMRGQPFRVEELEEAILRANKGDLPELSPGLRPGSLPENGGNLMGVEGRSES